MFSSNQKLSILVILLVLTQGAFGGGPRWVAGSSYFNSSVKGQPLRWKNGTISYYLDQNALTPLAYHTLMTSLVAQSANVWNNVSTAAVSITNGGSLNEDVSGSNVVAGPNGADEKTQIVPVDHRAILHTGCANKIIFFHAPRH